MESNVPLSRANAWKKNRQKSLFELPASYIVEYRKTP